MSFQDWGNMLAFLGGLVAFVVLMWGVVRYLFSGAVEVASQVSGSQGGVAFGYRNRRRGGKLIIGALIAGVVIGGWFYLENKFFPVSGGTTQTANEEAQQAQTQLPYSTGAISFNYPNGWVVYSPKADAAWVVSFQPANDNSTVLLVYDNKTSQSQSAFLADVKSQYQSGLDGWKVIAESPTSVSVRDASGKQVATASGSIVVAAFMNTGTPETGQKLLVFTYNGHGYIFNFYAPADKWTGGGLEATINNVYDSVTLK